MSLNGLLFFESHERTPLNTPASLKHEAHFLMERQDWMEFPRPFGPYELLRKIASGGMAEIYLARTTGIGGFQKLLVLKMIHPKWSTDDEFISMLIEEAKLAVQLNHTNIAQIFDLGRHEDTYYIAMEYVHGKDLFQLLVRTSELDTYLPFDVSAYIIEQVCSALYYAHSLVDPYGNPLNLIHRDISPQNIILSFSGEVKLIDFGIAKAKVRKSHTQIGIIKGKFYYMSPEQAWGRPLSHLTDIFSLGICLHEMLTGQMVYTEEDQIKLLQLVRKASIAPPSQLRRGVPQELENITAYALAHDANQRFPNAYAFQRALTEYLHRNCAGFTPTRVARLMWDLFPEESPGGLAKRKDGNTIDRREFASARPPESVIFDLTSLGKSAPPPSPTPPPIQDFAGPSWSPAAPTSAKRNRNVSTAQVFAPGAISGGHIKPETDELLTGDGLGARYPIPQPTGTAQEVAPSVMDSTHIVDWKQYQKRHPERSRLLRQEPETAVDEDTPTSLYEPSAFRAPTARGNPPPQGPSSPDDRAAKIAAAKARAKANQVNMKGKVAPKPTSGGDDRAAKIAAAKARAKANQDNMKGKVAPKPTSGGDDRAAKIAAAKARAKARPKKPRQAGEPRKGPNIVADSKGNVHSKVRVAQKRHTNITGLFSNSKSLIAAGIGALIIGLSLGGIALMKVFSAPKVVAPSHLKITSTPPEARIEFNGVDLDASTPYLVDNIQPLVTHVVRVTLPNHIPEKRTNIFVQPGSTETIHFNLKQRPGRLIISSSPPEAEIFIKGELRGLTPTTIDNLARTDNAFLQVTLKRQDFEDATITLQWKPGALELTHHHELEPEDKETP